MKKTRILALLCAILLIVSTASLASAEAVLPLTQTAERAMGWNTHATLKNKQTLNLYAWPDYAEFADQDGLWVDQILYETKKPVKATSNVDWLTVDNDVNYLPGFMFENLQRNASFKTRKATVKVSGTNFKGTIKVTQLANAQITKATRNKKKVTINVKLGNSPYHYYCVYRYERNDSGTINWNTGERIKEGRLTGKKITFNVKQGYSYQAYVGPALKSSIFESGYRYSSTAYCELFVTTVKGKESLYYYNFLD